MAPCMDLNFVCMGEKNGSPGPHARATVQTLWLAFHAQEEDEQNQKTEQQPRAASSSKPASQARSTLPSRERQQAATITAPAAQPAAPVTQGSPTTQTGVTVEAEPAVQQADPASTTRAPMLQESTSPRCAAAVDTGVCDQCRQTPHASLLRCGKCKSAHYCSRTCQQAAWWVLLLA